jgi:uncharacterized membrane protein
MKRNKAFVTVTSHAQGMAALVFGYPVLIFLVAFGKDMHRHDSILLLFGLTESSARAGFIGDWLEQVVQVSRYAADTCHRSFS